MSFDTIEFNSTDRDCIALLASQNPARYEAIRTKALLRTVGSAANNPRDAVGEVFAEIFAMGRNNGTGTFNKEIEELKKTALSKKTTPYELVGAAKDLLKRHKVEGRSYNSKKMTEHWTKLSMALALMQPTSDSIIPPGFDLEQEIANKAVIPKADQLKASLDTKPEKVYHESRGHLKESTIESPNWAEILGNMPKGSRSAALELLKGSKQEPRFDKAAKNLAWPEIEGPAEAENNRLNTLLQNLNPLHRGRKTYLMKALAIMHTPPESVEPVRTPITFHQKKLAKKAIEEIEKAEQPTALNLTLAKLVNRRKYLHPDSYKEILDKAKSAVATRGGVINGSFEFEFSRDKEAASKKPEAVLNNENDEFKNELALRELVEKYTRIEEMTDRGVAESMKKTTGKQLAKLLRSALPESARDIIGSLAGKLPAATYWVEKKMGKVPNEKTPQEKAGLVYGDDYLADQFELTPPPAKVEIGEDESKPSNPKSTGSFTDIVISATENKPVPLDKTYGDKNYTLLHVAMMFRGSSVVEEQTLEAKERGINPFPVDNKGKTPAHYCQDSHDAALMIKHHAPIDIPDRSGNTAKDASSYINTAFHKREKELKAARLMKQPNIEL